MSRNKIIALNAFSIIILSTFQSEVQMTNLGRNMMMQIMFGFLCYKIHMSRVSSLAKVFSFWSYLQTSKCFNDSSKIVFPDGLLVVCP